MIERLVESESGDQAEAQIEETLRPRRFESYIGQEQIKKNLQLSLKAAQARGESLDHVLLHGPPGLGKTTLAGVIASEMNTGYRATSGPAIERAGDLASLLTNLSDGDILFIDEIHRLPKTVEEVFYPAMEDYHIDIMLGKGPSAKSMRLDLPKFTIIGATTRAGTLSAPFRDRFGMVYRLDFYTVDEIVEILRRSASILKVEMHDDAARELATRSRLTPRIANRLLKRVRDFAQVHGQNVIDLKAAEESLKMLDIDQAGLDNADRRILLSIIENYNGGPVGVETIAAMCAEERTTIEDIYEPYLMQTGFLERTPRGRKVTPKAYSHLGLQPVRAQEKLL